MSHSVDIRLIADQEIEINGRTVNIHNIRSVLVDAQGKICDAFIVPDDEERYEGWLSEEIDPANLNRQ